MDAATMDLEVESINGRSRNLLQELYDNKELGFNETTELLAKLRILTREKTLNAEVLDKKCIMLLTDCSARCHTEAQKCLSNLILNYAHIRDQLIEPYVTCVETRLNSIISNDYHLIESVESKKDHCEVLYYDLRIIFLLSALCSAHRTQIRDRLVDLILKISAREAEELSRDNYLLVVESLKTLFNLTLDKCMNKPLAGDVVKKLFALVGTDRDLTLDIEAKSKLDLTDQLLVNLIHLLTNMPEEVYLRLSDEDVNKILNHLDDQLKSFSKHSFRDTVLPVLNVCANICKYNEEVRKRWFAEIIGCSTEFEKRPEEYDTLRGRLVKLMTSVDVHIKDIAAEFMHALCGGDTEKLITYTGFGNSAAFLSSRGLLSGARNDCDNSQSREDNIDYRQLRDRIDPITGKLDTPKKNPMEGMTDDEKEYHAHELANAITRLANLGVVKPMGIDQDGNITDLRRSSSGDRDGKKEKS